MQNATVTIEVNGKTMNLTHNTTLLDLDAFTGTTDLFAVSASNVFITPILNVSAVDILAMFNDYNRAYREGNGKAFIAYTRRCRKNVPYYDFEKAFAGEYPSKVCFAQQYIADSHLFHGLLANFEPFFDYAAFADHLFPSIALYLDGYVFWNI